ncbi:MAG: carbamoyl-phosphate synthase large subunit [Gammaproteobacteria bacterium]|jgi:carbamoyl-phosphate synthase large subunit|nr:carbamoyl-phosphate synthase large subunit [Gammaproteobacteria bacterium]MBT7523535.1 carbamoyl-phosphate synthase large subunit [Gammaproteobacteria bacterium]MBT7814683.1 carbamoyl-phosphate synthase large subunit [Gammaproteobacteria bacterium]
MPKRNDIKKILILGAGPIVIGQACEFDYSGVQACKALKEEGYSVVLVNSNVATIMTDPEMADATYIEPINYTVVEKIIKKEKPDAILPTMGGQTALNCALDLDRLGILKKYKIEMIGASKKAIDLAEDRAQFKEAMKEINLDTARSFIVGDLDDAIDKQKKIGFPVILRPSFTLGGSGGGIAYNMEEFIEISKRGLDISPTTEILLEESLLGWKEYEMEVVRDFNDNCIIICSIENFDPMGVHTGDSITVAPAQTLTDKEYQIMRDASIAILRKIGVDTGGSNVQFAVNPKNGKLVVIEMNPRVSRSSALASKATGFPIAKIAAKLAVGYSLDELKNEITGGATPASFEPTIDYVVTKIPRFAFEKFPKASDRLTTQMKSVGEVMSIGRNFQESLQKALSSLELDINGLDKIKEFKDIDNFKFEYELKEPGPSRILYVAEAFRKNYTVDQVQKISSIDPWFLEQILHLVEIEKEISLKKIKDVSVEDLLSYKKKGFSDIKISELMKTTQYVVRKKREKNNIRPVYKRVDTCAAEFPATTPYLYSTYEKFCESMPTNNKKIIVIGSGPNRIGQGIEFDYCCVHASKAAQELGYETIMINCNPETVSTDYDTSDRLYFEPITLESVLNIVDIEKPDGVIVQYGGQTPLKLVNDLSKFGVPIIGTSSKSIDAAEDREKFKDILKDIDVLQPANSTARNKTQALKEAEKIGYPIIVRPSYVLGGRAMEVIYDSQELKKYITEAVRVSNDAPVLIDKFLNEAVEIDVDAVRDLDGEVFIAGIMQHIEEAGVHSGDSACSIPTYSINKSQIELIKKNTIKMANKLDVKGLMNVQFAIKDKKIYVIEVNPRASRTIPFVSKSIGISVAKIAAKCMLGVSIKKQKLPKVIKHKFYYVKEVVFPFLKFPGVDPILGPEMKSTGEVMGIGKNFEEAFAKSQIATNVKIPQKGTAFISVKNEDKKYVLEVAKKLLKLGFKLVATDGTQEFLSENKIDCKRVNKVREGRTHIVDMIKNNEIDLIINTTQTKQAIKDSYLIRREALQYKVCYTTTIAAANALAGAVSYSKNLEVYKLQDIFKLA